MAKQIDKITYNFFTDKKEEYFLTYADIDIKEVNAGDEQLTLTLPEYLVVDGNASYNYGIYSSAFYGEKNIKKLVIPRTVTEIKARAFERSSIETIRFYSVQPPRINPETFLGMSPNLTIEVPRGAKSYYSGSNWKAAFNGDEEKFKAQLKEGDYTVTLNDIAPLERYNDLGLTGSVIIDKTTNQIGQMAYMAIPNSATINIEKEGVFTTDDNSKAIYFNKEIIRKKEYDNADVSKNVWPNASYQAYLSKDSDVLTLTGEIKVDQLAFQDTSIPTVELKSDGINLSPYAFIGAEDTEITLAKELEFFVSEADCIIKIEKTETETEEYHLIAAGNKLKCANINELLEKVSYIPAYFFQNRVFNGGQIIIPNNIKHIGNNSFDGASGIVEIQFNERENENDLYVDDSAFANLKSEPEAEISVKLKTRIGSGSIVLSKNCFSNTKNLTINFQEPSPLVKMKKNILSEEEDINISTSLSAFSNTQSETGIGVKRFSFSSPKLKARYDKDPVWKDLISKATVAVETVESNQDQSILVIPEGTVSIEYQAYANKKTIRKVYIPSSVTNIGSSAFNGCTNLREVIFMEPDKEDRKPVFLGHDVFRQCINLYSITLPKNVGSINGSCFRDCQKLCQVISYSQIIRDAANGSKEINLEEVMNKDFSNRGKHLGGLFNYCPSPQCLIKKWEGQNDTPILRTWTNSVGAETVYFKIGDLAAKDKTGAWFICNESFDKNEKIQIQSYNEEKDSYGKTTLNSTDGIILDSDFMVVYQEPQRQKLYRTEDKGYVAVLPSIKNTRDLNGFLQNEPELEGIKKAYHIYTGCLQADDNITKIIIPEEVKSIFPWSFKDCVNVIEIDYFAKQAKCLYKKNSTGAWCFDAFQCCGQNSSGINLNIRINENGQKIEDGFIDAYMFTPYQDTGFANIKEINISPDTKAIIKQRAFSGLRRLLSVSCSSNLTIEKNAFADCNLLFIADVLKQDDELVNDIKDIFNKTNLFSNASNQNYGTINIHNASEKMENLDNHIRYHNSGLQFFIGPKKACVIGYYQQYQNNRQLLGVISFPDNTDPELTYSEIQNYAFYNNKNVKGVDFSNIVDSKNKLHLRSKCFLSSGLCGTLVINLDYIGMDPGGNGQSCFDSCISLESIVFEGNTKIDDKNILGSLYNKELPASSFANCSSLNSVILPSNINGLGSNAFNKCSSLKSITLPSTIKRASKYSLAIGDMSVGDAEVIVQNENSIVTIESTTFGMGANGIKAIYVPDELVEQYKEASNWCSSSIVEKIKAISERPSQEDALL